MAASSLDHSFEVSLFLTSLSPSLFVYPSTLFFFGFLIGGYLTFSFPRENLSRPSPSFSLSLPNRVCLPRFDFSKRFFLGLLSRSAADSAD